jgi:hypothetical protein
MRPCEEIRREGKTWDATRLDTRSSTNEEARNSSREPDTRGMRLATSRLGANAARGSGVLKQSRGRRNRRLSLDLSAACSMTHGPGKSGYFRRKMDGSGRGRRRWAWWQPLGTVRDQPAVDRPPLAVRLPRGRMARGWDGGGNKRLPMDYGAEHPPPDLAQCD